jgi:hypothetical protein
VRGQRSGLGGRRSGRGGGELLGDVELATGSTGVGEQSEKAATSEVLAKEDDDRGNLVALRIGSWCEREGQLRSARR